MRTAGLVLKCLHGAPAALILFGCNTPSTPTLPDRYANNFYPKTGCVTRLESVKEVRLSNLRFGYSVQGKSLILRKNSEPLQVGGHLMVFDEEARQSLLRQVTDLGQIGELQKPPWNITLQGTAEGWIVSGSINCGYDNIYDRAFLVKAISSVTLAG